MTRWLVTIRLDEHRTMDVGHIARNAWHARWIHRQLHPQDRIIAIRRARGTMAGIDLQIDASELKPLQAFMAAAINNLDRATAVAMTRSAKAAQQAVKKETPTYLDNPTRWTMNSTFVKPATPDRLLVTVGFKDYSNTGVPAAQYLQPQAAGGLRPLKPFERRLLSNGILPSGRYAVPTGQAPLKFNASGNVPGSQYVQVLSRLRAMREAGFQANATDSARSKRKRKQQDYFVAEINGTKGIWARKGQRRIVPVFIFVKSAPKYAARFPVASILKDSFSKAWNVEFSRSLREQLAYEARR